SEFGGNARARALRQRSVAGIYSLSCFIPSPSFFSSADSGATPKLVFQYSCTAGGSLLRCESKAVTFHMSCWLKVFSHAGIPVYRIPVRMAKKICHSGSSGGSEMRLGGG